MKAIHIITVILLITGLKSVNAQQHTLDYISNEYLISSNELKTLNEINQFKDLISNRFRGMNALVPEDEIYDHISYYRISYQGEEGLAKLSYKKNTSKSITIEDNVNSFYQLFILDEDESGFVKDFFKTPTVHGGYYFMKRTNRIHIIMRSQPAMDFLSVSIDMNLNTDQKIAFAKDFISKTIFK